MPRRHRSFAASRFALFRAAWLLLALALPCAPALAQLEEAEAVAPHMMHIFEMTPDQFDSWVFNGQMRGNQWEPTLKSQLNLRIEAVDQVAKLNDKQKLKLTLAGRHDIQSFADQYDILKYEMVGSVYGQDEINVAYQRIQPLQTRWNAGIFDKSSLFYKVLPNTLSAEQLAAYEQEELKRRKFRYTAKVKATLSSLEGALPFTGKQRQQLEELILADTTPPKKFGQYDFQVVLYQASKLPEDKLKKIFDDAQFRQLKMRFNQAAGMEQMLIQQGWIEKAKK